MSPSATCLVREYRPSDRAAVERLVVELQAHEAALFDRMLAPEAVVPGYLDALLQDCAREDGGWPKLAARSWATPASWRGCR